MVRVEGISQRKEQRTRREEGVGRWVCAYPTEWMCWEDDYGVVTFAGKRRTPQTPDGGCPIQTHVVVMSSFHLGGFRTMQLLWIVCLDGKLVRMGHPGSS